MSEIVSFLKNTALMTERIFGGMRISGTMFIIAKRIGEDYARLAEAIETGDYETYMSAKFDEKKCEKVVDGVACENAAVLGDVFCDAHAKVEAPQCAGLTKKGSQCSKKAVADSEFCRLHSGKKENDVSEAAAKKTKTAAEPKVKCIGVTKKGTRCSKNAIAGSDVCRIHSDGKEVAVPEEKKEQGEVCSGMTVKGKRCSKYAIDGSTFCRIHAAAGQDGGNEEEKPEQRVCVKMTKKGSRCSKNATDGSDFCRIHGKEDAQSEEAGEKQKKRICIGLTTKGKRCRKAALENSDFCSVHDEGDVEEEKLELPSFEENETETQIPDNDDSKYTRYDYEEDDSISNKTENGTFYEEEREIIISRNYIMFRIETKVESIEPQVIQLDGDYQIQISNGKTGKGAFYLVSKEEPKFQLSLIRNAIRIIKKTIGEENLEERALELKGHKIIELGEIREEVLKELDECLLSMD